MKHLFQKVTLTLSITGVIFYSCKKEIPPGSSQANQATSNINKPPVAIAGPDQTIILPTDSVLLNGSASDDPDGRITAWQWTKIAGPPSFNLINANSVLAKANNLAEGDYHFELTVKDSLGFFDKDTTIVNVIKLYTNEIIFSNQPWGFNYIRLMFIPNIYTHVPAGITFKLYIKRDNTNTWVHISQQWTGNEEYAFEIDNGDLWIYSFSGNEENDTPDIKILY
jgi:hypothetical protein